MQNVFEIQDYDENFRDIFINQVVPNFDLWSVRPLMNEKRVLIDGTNSETEKLIDFFHNQSESNFPIDVLILLGNREKNDPTIMLNTGRKYFKIRFNKNVNGELGTPGHLLFDLKPNYNDHWNMLQSGFRGLGTQNENYPQVDIQGIIENVTRSLRAEYDEIAAKKESEALKRHNELERKFEAYKLAVQEQALNERKRALDEQAQELQLLHEELEAKKLEGLGTVKDYTKVIAGGLFEMGKTWLGLDIGKNDEDEDKSSKPKAPNSKEKEDELSNVKTKYKYDDDDGGFELVKKDDLQEEQFQKKNENTLQENIAIIKGILKDLPADVKLELLNDFIPDDDEEFQQLAYNETGTEEKTVQLNGLDGAFELIEPESLDNVKTENNNAKSNNKNNKTKKTNSDKASKGNAKSENVNVQSEYNITHHMLADNESQTTKSNGESLESKDSVENTNK